MSGPGGRRRRGSRRGRRSGTLANSGGGGSSPRHGSTPRNLSTLPPPTTQADTHPVRPAGRAAGRGAMPVGGGGRVRAVRVCVSFRCGGREGRGRPVGEQRWHRGHAGWPGRAPGGRAETCPRPYDRASFFCLPWAGWHANLVVGRGAPAVAAGVRSSDAGQKIRGRPPGARRLSFFPTVAAPPRPLRKPVRPPASQGDSCGNAPRRVRAVCIVVLVLCFFVKGEGKKKKKTRSRFGRVLQGCERHERRKRIGAHPVFFFFAQRRRGWPECTPPARARLPRTGHGRPPQHTRPSRAACGDRGGGARRAPRPSPPLPVPT